jgi:hypothetical protein
LYYFYFVKLRNPRYDNLYVRILVRLINILAPIYFRLTAWIPRHKLGERDDSHLPMNIISLTSYPARIHRVWLTIETLLRQTIKPDALILWLYKGEFPDESKLPETLLRMRTRGLEIRFCDHNLGPHKKYFYSMKEYPFANIITVDDDMLYPVDFLERLIDASGKHTGSICCLITKRIVTSGNGIMPYRQWNYIKENTMPLFQNLTMSGGGTLFPSFVLHEDCFDIEMLKEMALTADDLWLKVMSVRNNTKVVSLAGEYQRFFVPLIHKSKSTLTRVNVDGGLNDLIFKDLVERFDISPELFLS